MIPSFVAIEESEMKFRSAWGTAAILALAGMVLPPACSRRKSAEINAIVPSMKVNRSRAPLGSAIEVTCTWTVEAGAKRIPPGYRALLHFVDSHKVLLFTDDHVPTPAPETWEPGQTYSYRRTVFIPVYPYVGEVDVVMGLYPSVGRGARIALKGEDIGLRAYKVAQMEFLPQTENIFLVYKEGWHNPELHPDNPAVERTWTKKEGLVSFKNPKRDVIVYLEADTCIKCFQKPPVLTVSVGSKVGLTVPIEDPSVLLKKIRVKAEDLGTDEWVDLRLSMNQSFVPKLLTPPLNNDDRELGVNVYHLYVAEAGQAGSPEGVVDAVPLAAPSAATAKVTAPAKPRK
jgi:hypothetical protein